MAARERQEDAEREPGWTGCSGVHRFTAVSRTLRLVDQNAVVSIATGTRDLAESVTGSVLTSDRLGGSGPVRSEKRAAEDEHSTGEVKRSRGQEVTVTMCF